MADADLTIDDMRLVNCVSTGSHSQIWEVAEEGGGEHLAMKLLLPEAYDDPEQIAALKFEAKVSKSLDHPNIITFHRMVKNKEYAYLLMDYFRAPNLRVQVSGDLAGTQGRIKKILESVCAALEHMHDCGWLHKDVKPENILSNKSGEVRLIDFALADRYAKGIGKMFASKPKEIRGTRSYIAPETIRKQLSTPATDVYSLGIVLYEVLTGKTPFQGSSPSDLLMKHIKESPVKPSDINKNVTPETDRVVLKMLAKKPADRYQSMMELAGELRNLKMFHEDPFELKRRMDAEDGEDLAEIIASRLNSRADAERQERGRTDPEFARQAELERQKREELKAKKEAEIAQRRAEQHAKTAHKHQQNQPAAPKHQQGKQFPNEMPFQQKQYMPQKFKKRYPQGMPQPGMMPPGYPQPQPGQPYPMPQQPVPQQPQQPPQQQPQQQQPQQPPQQQPPAPPPGNDDDGEDLPFMTELPDIL